MARVAIEQCESCGRSKGERHMATVPRPSEDELAEWVFDMENAQATDGCDVESDGICEHGHQSWMLVMGLV
jgi:hypothetical protein